MVRFYSRWEYNTICSTALLSLWTLTLEPGNTGSKGLFYFEQGVGLWVTSSPPTKTIWPMQSSAWKTVSCPVFCLLEREQWTHLPGAQQTEQEASPSKRIKLFLNKKVVNHRFRVCLCLSHTPAVAVQLVFISEGLEQTACATLTEMDTQQQRYARLYSNTHN